jgi:hypothetical protein
MTSEKITAKRILFIMTTFSQVIACCGKWQAASGRSREPRPQVPKWESCETVLGPMLVMTSTGLLNSGKSQPET